MARQDLTPGLAPSQYPCMQPQFTPTSSPPTPLHLVAISILAIHSLSGAYRWASPQCSLRTAATLHIPHTPWQSIQKSRGCTPLLPSPKSVRLWGVHRHHTGWRLVGVHFSIHSSKSLGCIVSMYVCLVLEHVGCMHTPRRYHMSAPSLHWP